MEELREEGGDLGLGLLNIARISSDEQACGVV